MGKDWGLCLGGKHWRRALGRMGDLGRRAREACAFWTGTGVCRTVASALCAMGAGCGCLGGDRVESSGRAGRGWTGRLELMSWLGAARREGTGYLDCGLSALRKVSGSAGVRCWAGCPLAGGGLLPGGPWPAVAGRRA